MSASQADCGSKRFRATFSEQKHKCVFLRRYVTMYVTSIHRYTQMATQQSIQWI